MKKILLIALTFCSTGFVAHSQNPIIKQIFTADPAPIVYRDTVFLFSGHDTASVTATNYKMPDWHVFSSTDLVNWKSYGAVLSPQTFSWATGDAYAAQCIERNGKFYWFVSTFHKKDANSNGGAAIGVAVADHPAGPYKDAIGKALITNEMTKDMKHAWDDIDPTVMIDDDGQAYLFWGNGSCKWIKLKENMIERDSEISTFTPKNYIEGPWVYKRKGIYYLLYASKGTKPEMIEYCTAKSITVLGLIKALFRTMFQTVLPRIPGCWITKAKVISSTTMAHYLPEEVTDDRSALTSCTTTQMAQSKRLFKRVLVLPLNDLSR